MRFLLPTLLLFCSLSMVAQVETNVNVTGRHAGALNQAKGSKQTAEQRREQARRLQQQAKARELYKQRYDSMLVDSVAFRDISAEDSLAISKYILNDTDFPQEYAELLRNPISFDEELDTSQADSVALANAASVLEDQASQFLPDELGATSDPMGQFSNPVGDQSGAVNKIPSRPNPNLVKPEAAQALFKKVDMEQFQEAQADVQKLKKKYSELPDTRYPEQGTKRNSLADHPFKERLYFGGNISLQSTDPLILSSNLQVGYWIKKKWLTGLSFTIREQFTAQDSTSTISGDGHGYSLFTRYDIPKGFFAWGEAEWQIDKSILGGEQTQSIGWQRAMLVGIGREFRLGFVQMNSMILYDFNYQNNTLNPRPWVFRIGVQFSKKTGE